MDTKEVWKDVIGYEGLYQVSNLGRVKHLPGIVEDKNGVKKFVREKIKSHTISEDGYHSVSLYKNNVVEYFMVHRLVLSIFKPSRLQSELEVNHKDGNKDNNSLSNLEWVTGSENIQKGVELGTTNRRSVEFYKRMGSSGRKVINILDNKEFETMTEAAKYYNVSVDVVSKSCKENRCIKGLQFHQVGSIMKGRVHKLVDPKSKGSHQPRPVKCLETDQTFESRIQASKALGISTSSIVDSLRDGRTHAGYTFVEP